MVLMSDIFGPMVPPPQTVKDQKPLWDLQYCFLGAMLSLQLLTLDLFGSMLTGFIIAIHCAITRHGMKSMAKYVAFFGFVCLGHFFFDSLLLVSGVFAGRVSRRTRIGTTVSTEGLESTTYTVTTRTTPFVNSTEGVIYNLQSLEMIISSVAMGMGTYLAVFAYNEIERMIAGDEESMPSPEEQLDAVFGETAPRMVEAVGSASLLMQAPPRPSFVESFSGQAHKLK